MRGSFNGKITGFHPVVKGSIPLPRTSFYAPVAEWPNATDCKSVKPPVQIWPGVPIFIHCRLGARDCATRRDGSIPFIMVTWVRFPRQWASLMRG
jgi:hypothetical protein